MKKLLIIFFSLTSCYPPIHAYIGMSGMEFAEKNRNSNLSIEEATASRMVFKSCNQYGNNCMFYYFTKNNSEFSLYQIDRGEPVPNVIIQNK